MNDENLNQEFKGVWIPASIWLNKDLSLQEKMLLVKIDSFKECFASNQYLADFMGLSVPRVKSIIGNLRKLEFIHSKEERKGNLTIKRTLYIDPIKFHGIARIENDTKVVLKTIRGRIENDTHSNTVSNTVEKDISATALPMVNQVDKLQEAFDQFWEAGMKKLNKKKAFAAFKAQFKAHKKELNPDTPELHFTTHLINDVKLRLKNQQLGFDGMHPTTYLNGERWNDEQSKLADAGKPAHIEKTTKQIHVAAAPTQISKEDKSKYSSMSANLLELVK